MAKAKGLTLKDLIATQRRLAAQGNEQAAFTLQKLEELEEKETQVNQTAAAPQSIPSATDSTSNVVKATRDLEDTTKSLQQLSSESAVAEEVIKLRADQKKALLDQTGDGLNSNVIKLTKEIRAKFGKGIAQTSAQTRVDTTPSSSPSTLQQRTKEQANKYVAGTGDWVRDKFNMERPEKGSGIKGWAQSFKGGVKETFSLRGMIDRERQETNKGIFAGAIRRKINRADYIDDRMETEQGRTLNLHESEAARKNFGKQWDRINEARGGAAEIEKKQSRIDDLADKGYTTSELKRMQQSVDEDRQSFDKTMRGRNKEGLAMDHLYRNQRKADQVQSDDVTIPALASIANKVSAPESSSEETMNEQNMLVGQQTKILQEIADNTKPLGDLVIFLKGTKKQSTASEGNNSNESGGSLLGDALDMMDGPDRRRSRRAKPGKPGARPGRAPGRMGRILQGGRNLLSRGASATGGMLSRGASAAGNVVSKGASAVGNVVSKGASVAGNVVSKGASATGGLLSSGASAASKAGGSILSRAAGLGAKGLGAIGGVAMGAYDTYQGWSSANERLAAGEITEEQANVEKGGAVGEGVGGAGGAIAGAATGAAIGSVVPIVGTAIGGLIGGALGYFGGGWLGKKAGSGLVEGAQWVGDKVNYAKHQSKRGLGGSTAMENSNAEVEKRALEAGAIDKEGNIIDSKKYDTIRTQVESEIMAADVTANEQAEQQIGAQEQLTKTISESSTGERSHTEKLNRGTAAEKSIFGSTMLGNFLSSKGQTTSEFLTKGTEYSNIEGSNGEDQESQSTYKRGTLQGKRISSGSIFKADTYEVSAETKDGELVRTEIDKANFMKLQQLAKEGKYDEAETLFKEVQASKAKADMQTQAEVEWGISENNNYGAGATPATAATPPTPTSADVVTTRSADNAAATTQPQQPAAPVVVNAPTTVSTTNSYAPKTPPRSTESSYQQYNRQRFAY